MQTHLSSKPAQQAFIVTWKPPQGSLNTMSTCIRVILITGGKANIAPEVRPLQHFSSLLHQIVSKGGK